jgi:protein phosphatase PTC1
MNNNKNYHYKSHVANPLLPPKHHPDTQNAINKMGNNFHETKRYINPNSQSQKLNSQNSGIKKQTNKNNFDEGKRNVNENMNYLRNNNPKQQKVNLNLNNNNYNSNGNASYEIPNKSPNFNVTKNKFLMNFNLPNLINSQDRVINFGQDKNENNFKKNLRKGGSNLIQNNSFNIMNNNPSATNNQFNNMRGVPNSSPFPQSAIDYLKAASTREIAKTNSTFERNAQNNNSGSNKNNNNNNLNAYNNQGNNFKNYSDSGSSNKYSTNSNSKDDNYNNFEKNASSVKEYSYKEDPNTRFRGAMEDYAKIVDKFTNNPDVGLFAVYDGHGGGEVAKYLKNRIPDALAKTLSPLKNKYESDNLTYDIENSLNKVFLKVDEEVKLMPESEYMGSTAVVVLICKEKDNISPLSSRKVIYCANVGDSRCVIISNSGVKRLSYDHKASDPSEIDRVNNTGGMIFNGRVFGQLIITRAFGDSSLKRYGVSAAPYISKNSISDRDKYLVLASDGVWDVIEDDELLWLSQSVNNSDELTKLIIKTSLVRGTQDNLSCIVLKL